MFGVWPFAGGVGKDKSDVMLPQEREELRRHETIVPNFDGVTNAAGDADPGPGARFEFIVVFLPKGLLLHACYAAATSKTHSSVAHPRQDLGAIAKESGRVFPEERVRQKQKSSPVALRHRAVFSCA